MATNVLAAAAQARRERRFDDAVALLEGALREQPDQGPVLNALGLALLESKRAEQAIDALSRAAAVDPKAPPVWLNLAEACRQAGRGAEEIAALDGALAADPYLLPALLRKAQAQERVGDAGAVQTWRNLLAASPPDAGLPAPIRAALAHGRRLVAEADAALGSVLDRQLEAAYAAHPGADFTRARAYADQRAGRRKVYVQQPTAGHFPYLPAIEFFDRSLFPWFERLEAATQTIRGELSQIWSDAEPGFRPYVQFEAGRPVNQWADLNHSPAWSAWFLWEDGVRDDEHCVRCPQLAALLDELPLLDIPGKGPTAMFSILAPRTRIPPHTGSSNVRTTVHLPLVVPPGCGFRVGAETRAWREGHAWAFDDTIEHEAWNDSGSPRAILIIDAWNPLLTEAERSAVRAVG
jgi:aspartyl/asparaginyl beta-hydroxylase (cupin superfamily)